MYQTPEGLMEVRIQHVTFTKELKEKGTSFITGASSRMQMRGSINLYDC